MSGDKTEGSADRTPAESEEKSEAAQRIGRFAQYTAPAMLAVLVSGGQNIAFAAGTNL